MSTNDTLCDAEFEKQVAPFVWFHHEDHFSCCLSVDAFHPTFLSMRKFKGWIPSGHDWAAMAACYLARNHPEWEKVIEWDPEGGMFCAFSTNEDALKAFIVSFKAACEDQKTAQSLLR